MSGEAPDIQKQITALQREVRHARGISRVVLMTILLLLGVGNARALVLLPTMKELFKDMISSEAKLPHLTRLVFQYGDMPQHQSFIITGGILLLALLVLLVWRHSIFPALVAMLVAVLLALQWAAIEVGVNLPLRQMVASLSAK